MKHLSKTMGGLVLGVTWLAGVVLAKGWLALVAICIPPYAW